MEQELHETAVQPRLTTQWIGRSYRYFASVGSTNTLLKEAATAQALPAGAVFLTDYQSQGRGRLERRWEAPPGTSLLLSVLFRPQWPAERLSWLTMIAGLAVAEAMEAAAVVPVALKWPNDVVIEHKGVWRKVCGLLLEGTITAEERLAYAVLGVGMNVNITAAQLPAASTPPISLLVAAGRPISRLELLVAFLARLEQRYATADAGESPQPAWNRRLVTLGREVIVSRVGEAETLTGVAEDTDEWGQLRVRDAVGRIHTVAAGDVTLRHSGGNA